MTVRLPSNKEYAAQVQKEHYWLPKLAPHLPLPIPIPLAMGKPCAEYPLHWSIYQWLDGQTASIDCVTDLSQFATSLGRFLIALHQCDTTGGPVPSSDNFYRGGNLGIYDAETQQAIEILAKKIDVTVIKEIWHEALTSTWQNTPVWVHGDVAIGNLLVENGQLNAIIDFGQLCIGDPACDLSVLTQFDGRLFTINDGLMATKNVQSPYCT